MSIEYLGLSSINGPLIALEGVQGAFFDEIVEFVIGGSERKIGRIIELYEDKAVIQVFEGSENMSLKNTHTRLTGHPMEVSLAPDMLGRTFNGIGKPIDGLGPLITDVRRDVNGLPLNLQIPTLVLLGENGEKLESLTAVKGRDIIQAANGKESVLEFNLTQAQAKKLGQTENILLEVKASTTNNQEVVVAADAKLSFDLKLVAKAVITDLDDF